MTKQIRLMTAAVAAFERWRQTRQHPTQKTPEKRQQQAVVLLEHFPAPQIVAKLNINGNNLKRWDQSAQPSSQSNDVAAFVPLPYIDEPKRPAPDLSLELAFNNGCHLRLQGDISPQLLTALTQSVIAQPGANS
jgi:hypothetical protein